MEHLDEGTIHAWIDGALDTPHAREVETHVAQCASCSAMVAEARGLVAASSRILTALDDVPGGVVPTRAPVAAPSGVMQAKRRRIAAWVPALAAAALIVAVGLQVSNQRASDVMSKKEAAQDTQLDMRGKLAAAADSALIAQQQPLAIPQPRLVAGGAAGGPVGAVSARDQALSGARQRAEARLADVGAGGGVSSPTAQRAAAPSPPAAIPTKDVVAESRAERAPTLKSGVEPAPAAAAPADPLSRRRLDEVVVTATSTLALPGCYRIETQARESVLAKAANVAGGATRAAADARSIARPAPAPAAASGFAATSMPAIVRLDTTARPQGLPVLAQRTDSIIGWWRRSGSDTVHVRFLAGAAVTLTTKNRINCPNQ